MLNNKKVQTQLAQNWLKKAIAGHWFHDMPITCIIFCRAMMSEVEKARHKQMMLNKERAEPIQWGLHGHEHNFNCSACVTQLGFPSHLKFSSAFVFTHPPLPLYTLFTDKSI